MAGINEELSNTGKIFYARRSWQATWCSAPVNVLTQGIISADNAPQSVIRSGNPFNNGSNGRFPNQDKLEEESQMFEVFEIPCYGFKIPAAIVRLINLMKIRCDKLGIFQDFIINLNLKYCYDDYSRGKPSKTMEAAAELLEKTNKPRNQEVASKFRELLSFIKSLDAKLSFDSMTIETWSSNIFKILGIDIMSQLKNTEFLQNLGLDAETCALFDLQTVNLLVKVVAGFKPEGCLSDIVNLIGAITNKTPKDEDAIVEMIDTFTTSTFNNYSITDSSYLVDFDTKYNFLFIVMDAEIDDWLSWLLLKLMKFNFETYILLPALEGEIEIDKVKYTYSLDTPSFKAFVEKCRTYGKVVFQNDVTNLKALTRTFKFEQKIFN